MTVVVLIVICTLAGLGLGAGLGARWSALRAPGARGPERGVPVSEVAGLRRRLRDAEAGLARAEAALEEAVSAAHVASAPVAATLVAPPRAEAELVAAGSATNGAGHDRRSGRDRRVVDAVWQLQRLELERNRRRNAFLTTAVGPEEGKAGLAQAFRDELIRVREEIGTPGDFHSDLDIEPDPAAALLALRSVQSTLDVLARRAQALDLHLGDGDGALAVTVVCEGSDDSQPADRDTAAIAGAITHAGGDLVVDRDSDGRLRARLRVMGE